MQWQELFEKLPAGEKAHVFTTEAKRQYALKNFEIAAEFRKLAKEAKQSES
ncbi:MAG: hypothetical protein ABF624_02065 [Liquorilactobacillus ghanensis]|uniref:hypothetical protein n=1 Tax=Liquorilactobacillus ghanensis TaxID=399370 RepID=UPI0039EA35B4